MTHRRRLDQLEETLRSSVENDDALCFKCQGPGSYRRAVDTARLQVGAMGKLHGVDPEEARAKLRDLLNHTPPESDRCPRCGGLTAMGAVRQEREKWGLD